MLIPETFVFFTVYDFVVTEHAERVAYLIILKHINNEYNNVSENYVPLFPTSSLCTSGNACKRVYRKRVPTSIWQ